MVAGTPKLNLELLDALLDAKRITTHQYESSVRHATTHWTHVEEALLALGIFEEMTLLKFQANHYRTHFVSTKKLSSAPLARAVLDLVDRDLATALHVLPVKHDAKNDELTIVTVHPGDTDVLQRVRDATGVSKVRAVVARPTSIRTEIENRYGRA